MAPDSVRSLPSFFWRQAIMNSIWLSADRLVRGVFSLIVLICIGRFLGPELYGIYSYAVAFVMVFTAFGSMAHEGIVVRELVREDRPREVTLGSAFVLRAVGGVTGMMGAIGMAWFLPKGQTELGLIAIIAAGLLFQPFDIIDHWFQSRLQSRYAVIVRIGVALVVGAVKVMLAMQRATLSTLAWMSVAEALLVVMGLLGMYRRKGLYPSLWRTDRHEVRVLFHESWPMAATSLIVILFMKLDQIMLAWFVGFRDLGVYAAAVRLVDLWNFLPMAVLPSLYPAVVSLRKKDKDAYAHFLQQLLHVFYLIALVVIILNVLLGRTLLERLFGAEYGAATPALQILSITAVFHYSAFIRAQWLLIEHKVIYHLLAGSIAVAVLATLNTLLIPRFGFVGAAMANVIGYAVAGYGTSLIFPALRPIGRLQTRAFFFR